MSEAPIYTGPVYRPTEEYAGREHLHPRMWERAESHEDLVSMAEQGIAALLALLGEDPGRDGITETPARVVKAYRELAARPGDPATILGKTFPGVEYPTDELIAVGPVPFTSLCEHHLLPFTGHAWVAYLPGQEGVVVGLSKLARIVDHYAMRPQVQERLTTQIADALDEHLHPRAAGCIIAASHTCMSLRGVRKLGAVMRTSVLRGDFKTDAAMRAEFLALTNH